MASNTQNLNLYKADPVADANDTFNIDTLLNDNWDKIDQKAGEQENKLTALENEVQQPEYSRVLTQNKPVFSVGTGYDEQGKYVDVGETVVKGQINHVRIKGSSVNQMVKNGNLVTSYISADNGTFIGTKTDGTYVQNANYSTNEQVFNVSQNDKLFIYHKVKTLNIRDWALLRYSDGSSVNIGSYALRSSEVYGIATADKNGSVNVKFAVGDAGILKRDYQTLINMTANGIEHWTEEQMLELCCMGYWDGTKSTKDVRLISHNKNYVKNGNVELGIAEWVTQGGATLSVENNLFRTETTGPAKAQYQTVKVKPNTDYVLSAITQSGTSSPRLRVYDVGTINIIAERITSGSVTFNTGNRTKIDVSMSQSGIGFCYFSKIQLEEGTAATDYVKHEFNEMYVSLPDDVDSLHSLPNGTKDEVRDGKLYKKTEKYVLQNGDIEGIQNESNVQLVYTKLNFIPDRIEPSDTNDHLAEGWTPHIGPIYNNTNFIGQSWTNLNGRLYFIIAPGTYANLAVAQADLAGTTLIYQLAQEKQYDMNITPLTYYPNGTIIVEPWRRMVLQSEDISSITTGTNVQRVICNNLGTTIGAANWTDAIDNKTVLSIREVPVSGFDDLSNINTYYTNVNQDFVFIVPEGTYANLAAAQADLTGTVVQYATDPSQTTLPTISYKSPINAAAQRDSNTNAIAQLSDIVAEHDLIVAGQKNEVQQPEYSGGLTQNKPVFSVGTGYDEQGKYVDVGETVVKGQFSDTKIKGLSVTQSVINGDFSNGTTGWSGSDGTSTQSVVNNNTLKITGTGTTANPYIYSAPFMNTTDTYFIYAKVRVTNSSATYIRMGLSGGGATKSIISPQQDVWYEIFWINTSSNGRISFLSNYADAATANGKVLEIDGNAGVFAINMTASGIEDYTEEQMLEIVRQGYWEGTKSTNSVRAKSIGKNLFDVKMINTTWFAGGEPLNHEILDILSSKISVKGNNSGTSGMGYRLKVKPNTTYVFSCEIVQADVNGNINISSKETWYGRRLTYHASSIGEKITKTFTTGAYETELNISFNKYGGDNNINILENIQLEEGSTATDYAKHEFSEMYVNLPDDVDALHSLPNGTKDEISDNKLYKRISEDYTITSDLFKALVTSLINVDLVLLDLRNQAPNILKSADLYKVRMQNSSEVPITSRDNVENIGKFYAATGTTEGSIYLIIAKGQYPNLATAQANIINDYSLTTLTYQLAQEKQYDMNITPLTCYPNGTIIVESWNTAVLKESDIASIHTSAAEADVVALNILDKQQVVLGGSSTIGNFEINGWDEVPVFDWDVANIVGKFYISAVSGVVAFIVPKGTYANLAAAQAGLAGIVVQYVTDPSQTTLPTISYKAPINVAAQRDSNTNAVAQLSDIVAEHDLILLSIAAGQK